MLLDKLKNSIPVNSKNLQKTTIKSLLVLSMMSISAAQADTFYDDYSSKELKETMSKQVKVLGRFREVKLREALGCPTGELRSDITGILRMKNVKGHKLDSRDKNFANNVDSIVTADYYKNTGECGIKPPTAEDTEETLLKRYKTEMPKEEIRNNINVASKRDTFELPQEKRKSLELPVTIRKFKL